MQGDPRAGLVVDAAPFEGEFERDWSVGSFTSLTRQTSAAPMRAQEETLLEEAEPAPLVRTEDAPWHRFPRGSVPGNFLHEQLEWMGQEGFAIVDEELELGLRSIAVPIMAADNTACAAINVGVHASRVSSGELVQRVLPRLRSAAAELSLCLH